MEESETSDCARRKRLPCVLIKTEELREHLMRPRKKEGEKHDEKFNESRGAKLNTAGEPKPE